MLTTERLKELLHYDPATGVFTRIKDKIHPRLVGKVAGAVTGKYIYVAIDGKVAGAVTGKYIYVAIDGKVYLAHRLAWFYVYGIWPLKHIDHIDGNRKNNTLSNLRDVDRATNQQNFKRPFKNNSLGILGVSRSTRPPHRFVAQLCINGKNTNLGTFDTPEEASAVYLQAKRKHHEGCTI